MVCRDDRRQNSSVAVLNAATGDHRQYQHCNGQYSIYAVTDQAGSVLERYEYSPYGAVLIMDASGTPRTDNVSDIDQEFLYTGQRLDPETNLYYFKNRYYDSAQGKFISRDPLGYTDGMNLYAAYFAMRFSMDPTGEQCAFIAGVAVLGVGLTATLWYMYSANKEGDMVSEQTSDAMDAMFDNELPAERQDANIERFTESRSQEVDSVKDAARGMAESAPNTMISGPEGGSGIGKADPGSIKPRAPTSGGGSAGSSENSVHIGEETQGWFGRLWDALWKRGASKEREVEDDEEIDE